MGSSLSLKARLKSVGLMHVCLQRYWNDVHVRHDYHLFWMSVAPQLDALFFFFRAVILRASRRCTISYYADAFPQNPAQSLGNACLHTAQTPIFLRTFLNMFEVFRMRLLISQVAQLELPMHEHVSVCVDDLEKKILPIAVVKVIIAEHFIRFKIIFLLSTCSQLRQSHLSPFIQWAAQFNHSGDHEISQKSRNLTNSKWTSDGVSWKFIKKT